MTHANAQRAPRDKSSGNNSISSGSSEEDAFVDAPSLDDAKVVSVGLEGIGIAGLLQDDPRPTFVVDLADTRQNGTNTLDPVYCNPSLVSSQQFMDVVLGHPVVGLHDADSHSAYSEFKAWVIGEHTEYQRAPFMTFVYGEALWSGFTTCNRWRVISGIPGSRLNPAIGKVVSRSRGNSISTSSTGTGPAGTNGRELWRDITNRQQAFADLRIAVDASPARESRVSISGSRRDWGFDILRAPLATVSAHVQFVRSVDWNDTPIGPIEDWPPQLRLIVNLIMKDTEPAVVFWGPELIMIYNEPYIELVGAMHPAALGASAPSFFGDEIWDIFRPIIAQNLATGEVVERHDIPIFITRHGFTEETYFKFRFFAILDDDGRVLGHLEPVTEMTRQKVADRRLSTLLSISERTPNAPNLETFWKSIIQVLADNDKDIPFALLYSVEDEGGTENDTVSVSSVSSSGPKQCTLQGTLGVPPSHQAAPPHLDLHQSHDGFMPSFREAMRLRRPTLVRVEDGSLPERLIEGLEWRGFGEPCRSAVICPISPTAHDNVLGFMIIGINPRRPYDDDYQHFIQVAIRLFNSGAASVVLLEEEARQAAIVQARLSEQLLLSQREIERNELKFQRFAERADVAIWIVDATGQFMYRNERWFEIFQPAKEDSHAASAWLKLVGPEDFEFCQDAFKKLMIDKQSVSFELRLNRPWQPPEDLEVDKDDTTAHYIWILCSAYPELAEDGSLIEVLGCVTDISRQKWAESFQRKRTEDALESKRQLENFIDTTSHEMRNPLSAIVQCADEIITSHSNLDPVQVNQKQNLKELLRTGIEAAQTIVQCAEHQKRIVDDVLTMSKIDSDLLVIAPLATQPEALTQHAVKMFEGEARAADIAMGYYTEPSYRDLGVDWVQLDPTRLLQVLINLITNAIKFTRFEAKRRITVSLGASTKEPSRSAHGVAFIRSASSQQDPTQRPDWGTGDPVYLHFAVRDTGCGLSANERSLLFARFSQASPRLYFSFIFATGNADSFRTHTKYGGSGLGLFISRRLSEMQGGAIGFDSQRGVGSTFAFYIKARRSDPPVEDVTITTGDTPEPTTTRARAASAATPAKQAPTEGAPTIAVAPQASEPQPAEPPQPSRSTDKLHVLVVEDNLVNQRVLAKQLRNLGCAVEVANHGGEALDFLRTTKFWAGKRDDGAELSVILMDWEMPVMDGLTCVRRIRGLQLDGSIRGHVPVIAVTANVRSQQVQVAMEAGMDDVVSKPFRVPELVKRMQVLIENLSTPS